MKRYGTNAGASGKGFVYENKQTGERVISGKPNAVALPGKPSDWRYVEREK